MDKMKLLINNDIWTVRFFQDEKYQTVTEDHDGSEAITLPYKKTIDFNLSELTDEAIEHELVHANWYYLCLDENPNISLADLEEMIAVFYTRYNNQIQKQKRLIKKFIKQKKLCAK